MSDAALRLPSTDAHTLWADIYDRTPNPLLALEERAVGPWLPLLEGKTAADLACGTGRWLRHLTGRGARSVGLDLTGAMLAEAARKPGLEGRLVQADCIALPLGTSTVDFAICSFGLGYMPDVERFAGEVARVVTDRGQFLLSDLHPSAEARGWKRRFRRRGILVEIPTPVRRLQLVLRACALAGFDLIDLAEPVFGEEEGPIFAECGKEYLFRRARGRKAIFVARFRRRGRRDLGLGEYPNAR